jgi:acetylglutamate kinase
VTAPVVLKFGGELLEDRRHLDTVVSALASLVASCTPLVVVHGGGREIDAALKTAGIPKQQVDGLRITDERTLDVVVSVLAGTVNTRFVAALNAAGVPAVGLTGADAGCGHAAPAAPHRASDGRTVDLGCVGVPAADGDVRLLTRLVAASYVPVMACVGATGDGRLLNVNADTLAGYLAAQLGARRLVIAGTTPGVLDASGATVAVLDPTGIAELVAARTATAGMIAKLRACEYAISHGVEEVVIVDGRSRDEVSGAATATADSATRVVASLKACASPAEV